jgi:hypothetical protein
MSDAMDGKLQQSLSSDASLIIGLLLVLVALLFLLFVIRKLYIMCQQMKSTDIMPGNPNAKSQESNDILTAVELQEEEKLNKEEPSFSTMANNRLMCLNCNMIQMGSALSYNDGTCPQCGNIAR